MKFILKLKTQFKIAGLFLLSLPLTLFVWRIQVNADVIQFPFYWDSIAVNIEIEDNGDMLVTETQKYVFNRQYSNSRFRYISLDRVDDITDVSVAENHEVIPSQITHNDDRLLIRWQHELNSPESHTFVIKYRVIGGFKIDAREVQIDWQAIFKNHRSPIQNAVVKVNLPPFLADNATLFDYYPDNLAISAQITDDLTIEFIAQQPILSGQELAIKVSFPQAGSNLQKANWQKSITDLSAIETTFKEQTLIVLFISIPFLIGTYLFIVIPTTKSKSSFSGDGNYGAASSSDSSGDGGGG